MKKKLQEGQTLLALDPEDISIVLKSSGEVEVYIGSKIDEDSETEQNYKAVVVLLVLNNLDKYNNLTEELLESSKEKS